MLSKGGNNEILATWGEGNDPNASVFGALDPANQALRDEALDCHVPPIRTHPRPTYPDPPYSARFQTFYPLWGTSNPTNLDPPYSMESILVKG